MSPTFPTRVSCLLMSLLLYANLSHRYSTCSPCSRHSSSTDVNAFTFLFTSFNQSSHSVLSQILSLSRASRVQISLILPLRLHLRELLNSPLFIFALSPLATSLSSLSDACWCVHEHSHHVSSILRVLLHLSLFLHPASCSIFPRTGWHPAICCHDQSESQNTTWSVRSVICNAPRKL